jgi:hypothetical protein
MSTAPRQSRELAASLGSEPIHFSDQITTVQGRTTKVCLCEYNLIVLHQDARAIDLGPSDAAAVAASGG